VVFLNKNIRPSLIDREGFSLFYRDKMIYLLSKKQFIGKVLYENLEKIT